MFLLISGGHIGAPKRYTNMASPCKALPRCAKPQQLWATKDLRLGQIVYILVFCNISFSWLPSPDGFQFIFAVAWQRKGPIQKKDNQILFAVSVCVFFVCFSF